ncbi:MAG: class I SAM-dependent methyltransferase [Acidobacteria bacterium]|nr:class I SAM-dependent methyltransferase [Acidobacteriota bacterium]
MIECPICSPSYHQFFFRDKFREYFRCSNCSLIFVPPEFHPTRPNEKARYEEHNNDPDDQGYREFLERIVPPIKERMPKGARGLDFGCGPTPLLADMLTENGYLMEIYDSFYETERKVLERSYDFIVSTEVLEHLSQPLSELQKLLSILKPGGIIAIMTLPFDSSIDFSGWHYKNDPTHICFYSAETFDWLAAHLGLTYERVENDIFIFQED